MKKIIAIAAMLLMTATALQAQVSFGIKGGLNVSSMSLDSKVLDSKNQCGFYVGPAVKFTLPVVGLGVDAAALYNQRTSKVTSSEPSTTDETVKHKSISIPVNLRYQVVGLGDMAGLFLFTGPQFDFSVGNKSVVSATNDWTFKSSDFSWNVGLGLMLANHLQVNANYNIGLSKTNDVKDNAGGTILKALGVKSSRENTWQVGLAYWF